MTFPSTISRGLFCAAAGISAAAAVDPLVETLSNAGVFGHGNFTDHSTIDVLPALTIGFALALAFVGILAWRMYVRRTYAPTWLRASASVCSLRSFPLLFPGVLAVQLASVFTMETVEQIVTAGHPLGATIWLGGPVAIALLLHAAGAAAATLLLSNLLRRAACTIVQVLRRALRAFLALRRSERCARVRLTRRSSLSHAAPCVERLNGRAPPTFLSIPA